MRSSQRLLPALLVAACLVSSSAAAQEIVFPRTADKSQVRYFDFDWRHVDILVGPEAEHKLSDTTFLKEGEHPAMLPPQGVTTIGTSIAGSSPSPTGTPDTSGGAMPAPPAFPQGAPDAGTADAGTPASARISPWLVGVNGGTTGDGGMPLPPRTGGVRLYYYQREQTVAERATNQIVSAYRHLVDEFDYVPTKTFPYILYNSYQEFLETNLFPLQEGVLGVTSPVDLKLTLPYFGDHRMFEEVSLHEMSHQFTIQKVRSTVERSRINGEPLEGMPLWFIEGLAEFYAHHGIDDEAEMLIRDIVVNPSVEHGYAMLDFFEDRPQSVLWTYKVGQIRCAFLEETYGKGFIQRVLNASTALVGSGMMRRQGNDFGSLMERLTGDEPRATSRKFEAWLKRRAFQAYLNASQDTPQVKPLPEFAQHADSLATSPDGDLLMFRTLEPETFRAKLQLVDRRAASRPVTVASDGVPGAESLHLVFGRSFAVGRESLVYVAEANGGDIIYWRKIDHQVVERPPGTVAAPMAFNPTATSNRMKLELERFSVQLSVGSEVKYALRSRGIIAAYGPALAPDGRRVAFVGLDDAGVRDVFVLTPKGNSGDFALTRVTNDIYGERQVAWAPDDSLIYNSDATGTGKYNLFKARMAGLVSPGSIERLTREDRDDLDPAALPDGRVLFTAYARGSADLYEVKDGQVIRRTDVATGLFDVGPGPEGGVWALFHHSGERTPVLIKSDQLISAETVAQGPEDAPRPFGTTALTGSQAYNMFNIQNWEPGNPYAFISGGVQGIYGQIFANASDRLRNHALVLYASVYGSFDLTDGFFMYLNQERRVTWGTGVFQSVRLRYDQSFPTENLAIQILSGERFFGALGTVRYPFNQFVYVQADMAVGGVNYFLSQLDRFFLATPEYSGADRDLLSEWNQLNQGPRAQTEATLRFGYDTLRYHPLSGPLDGTTVLLEATGGVQPFSGQTYSSLRLDAAHYIPIDGRIHLMFRAGAGVSLGGRYATNFQLSSFDTIRGVPFSSGSLRQWLFGRNYFFSTAELKVPLNNFIRLILFSDIEAIAGLDFGGTSNDLDFILKKRVLDYVLGVNFSLGPLQFRLHFAKPVGIGAKPSDTFTTNGMPSGGLFCNPRLSAEAGGCPDEVKLDSAWVTNFSIGVAGLPGFFDRARPAASPHW
ncbi:MAG TPA: tolB protein precursor protein [Myxococcaceae bacterium]